MLFKLIKYEFKATYKVFSGLFILIISFFALMLLTKGDIESDLGGVMFAKYALYTLSSVVFFLACAASAAAIFIYAFMRFYKTIFGNEAYLTHSLPVKAGSLITAKTLVMTLWAILTTALIFLCSVGLAGFQDYADTLTSFTSSNILTALRLSTKKDLLIIGMFSGINTVLGLAKYLTVIYTSMSVGFSFNKNKKFNSLFCWILVSFALNIISGMFTFRYSAATYYGSSGIDVLSTVRSYSFPIVSTLLTIIILHKTAVFFLDKRLNIQ